MFRFISRVPRVWQWHRLNPIQDPQWFVLVMCRAQAWISPPIQSKFCPSLPARSPKSKKVVGLNRLDTKIGSCKYRNTFLIACPKQILHYPNLKPAQSLKTWGLPITIMQVHALLVIYCISILQKKIDSLCAGWCYDLHD